MSESAIATVDDETTDWEQVARNGLVNGVAKGNRKLNRRNLTDLCKRLASGIPLETAARLQGIQPQAIRAWAETRPTAWQAIERARATGEQTQLRKIAAANDWKAADRLLGLMNSQYQQDSGAASSGGGPAIQVVINVPLPQLVEPGDKPVIDVTPNPAVEPAK